MTNASAASGLLWTRSLPDLQRGGHQRFELGLLDGQLARLQGCPHARVGIDADDGLPRHRQHAGGRESDVAEAQDADAGHDASRTASSRHTSSNNGQHRRVCQYGQRLPYRLVQHQAEESRHRRQHCDASVQARYLRMRQSAHDQALVVMRSMRLVPALAARHAQGERHDAVEQERREDHDAELDGQPPAANAQIAEQAQSGEVEAQKGAADIAHEQPGWRQIVHEKPCRGSRQQRAAHRHERVHDQHASDRQGQSGDHRLRRGQAVDAVHEVVDVRDQRDPSKRQRQREQQRQLALLHAREREQERSDGVRRQSGQGRQRAQVVHERNGRDQNSADEPAHGSNRECFAAQKPGAEADEKTGHDRDAAAAGGRHGMRAARVGNVERPLNGPAAVHLGAENRGHEGQRSGGQHASARVHS